MISPEFLLTALIVVLIPGTGVIYTVSTGLFRGRRASLFAALGCTAGIVPALLASVLGLAALLHVSAIAFNVVKWIGVAYLLYLAWGMWRDQGGMSFAAPDERGLTRIAVKGFLINILNPKLSIFFFAFLPQFVVAGDAALAPLAQMLLLGAVFMAMTLVVFVVYGLLAHGVRGAVLRSTRVQRWLQRGFAATFAALGLKLALAER